MAELIQRTDTLNQGREKLNEAIKDAEQAKNTSVQADGKATQALAKSESTQTQLDTIVIEGDSSVEAAQARVDETGGSHPTLKARIDDGFTEVKTQMDGKASKSDLEATNQNLAMLQTEKASKNELASGLYGKRDKNTAIKSVDLDTSTDASKIKLINLSEEVQAAMAGTAPVLSSVGDRTLTETKYADGSVSSRALAKGSSTLEKQTIDILPREIQMWSASLYSGSVGKPVSPTEFKKDGIRYRHDSLLIEVVPGTTLKFANTSTSLFQISVHEYDVNKFFIKDSGYQTDSLTLGSTTRYVRFVCSTKDYSDIELSDKLKNLNITVEIPYERIREINSIEQPLNENLIDLVEDVWEGGAISNDASGNLTYLKDSTRVRTRQRHFVKGFNNKRKLYYKVPSGYKLASIFVSESDKIVTNTGWLIGEGYFYIGDNSAKCVYILAHEDDSAIMVSEIRNLQIIISVEKIPFEHSKGDLERNVRKPKQLRMNDFKERVRYIGHAGTAVLGPENTIPAYQIAAETMKVWAAECDLCITSDGHLVLMHDITLDRTTTGSGLVSEKTLAEIKQYHPIGYPEVQIPTFEEYLAICRDYGLYPVVEIKNMAETPQIIDKVLETLKLFRMLENCIIISFSWGVLNTIRTKNKEVNLALLFYKDDVITQTTINDVIALGNCGVNLYSTSITKEVVTLCHKNDITVMAYVVNDKTLAKTLISYGVDMIATDIKVSDLRDPVPLF